MADVSAVPAGEAVRMIIEIMTSDDGPPFGHLHVRRDAVGTSPRIEFVGWMGLLGVLASLMPQPDLGVSAASAGGEGEVPSDRDVLAEVTDRTKPADGKTQGEE